MKTNNNFTVLIVDDEKFNIELAAVYLKEEGYKISFALNAKAALESVIKKDIDLILLDINMPEVDGFALCKMLKSEERTKDIPIIFLTAQTDIEYISKAFEVGGVDYITKPFNGVELKARVRTHLKNVAYLEEIKHKQSKLAQLSITDPLTKLSNALYFDTQLKQKLTNKEPFWFVYVKINRFEKINSVYGYQNANKIIRIFSKLLERCAPKSSLVAKLHGVSFALLLKDYKVDVMKKIFEELTTAVLGDEQLQKALSFSIVFQNVKEDQTTSLSSLYKNANSGVENLQREGGGYLFL